MQYGALRRKIGGTYKDFFKSYVEGEHSTPLFETRISFFVFFSGPVEHRFLNLQNLFSFAIVGISGWAICGRRMGGQDMQDMQEGHQG